jgi:hypothetical protein
MEGPEYKFEGRERIRIKDGVDINGDGLKNEGFHIGCCYNNHCWVGATEDGRGFEINY